MKTKIKKIMLILLIVIGIIIIPISTKAIENKKVNYYNVTEKKAMLIDNIYFSDIVFRDNTNTTSLSYGLVGNIINNSADDRNVNIKVTFYNEAHDIITTNIIGERIKAFETLSYTQMLNADTISQGYTTNNIKFYTIEVTENKDDLIATTPSKQEEYKNNPYVIDAYDIKIKVNEDNSFDITETITAFFTQERHGIYRTIPTLNEIKRLNGKTSTNTASISKLKVSEQFQTSRSLENYEIKIGDPNKTITGSKTYTINYTYKIGKDPLKDVDEFYFNLIGTGWTDTVIGNITFKIEMPKSFDKSKLGFSSGEYGSIENDKISYNIENNTITGKYNGILKGSEALTVRLELEEDYFTESKIYIILDYLLFIIPTLFIIVAIYLWNKYGKDAEVVEVINFYPPENLNSLELAFNYKGKVTDNDVISLLIYLANKGYLKINEEKFSTFSTGDFSIQKLKEYDGDNEYEKQFFDNLWKHKKKTKAELKDLSEREKELNELDDVVTSNDLKYKFHTTVGKIMRGTNAKRNKNKIIVNRTKNKKWLLILFIAIIYLIGVLIPSYNYGSLYDLGITLLICLMGLPFLIIGTIDEIPLPFRIFLVLSSIIMICVVSLGLPMSIAITTEKLYLISTIYSMLSIIIIFICLSLLPKRTPYGNEILGQIKGFKTFLEASEKEQLEKLVEENPNYFYDILPYTYVLGISNKWIKKFELLAVQEPDWYTGRQPFNPHSFGKSLNRTFTSASSSMNSTYSSSGSSGSSSGGGFSGGGSGGGGGGSW